MRLCVASVTVLVLILVPILAVAANGLSPAGRSLSPIGRPSLGAEQHTCPQSGGVILYWNSDYSCDNGEGDAGFWQRTSPGVENIYGLFNDKASSLRVPSGWSVRLYQHWDRGGASTCRSADLADFGEETFDGGSVPLNDEVSSFEVFNGSDCSAPANLWEHADYQGVGCLMSSGSWTNVCDFLNDQASSVHLQAGFAARLYKDADLLGSSRCFPASDNDFSDDTFEDGSPLNDEVSSAQVFYQTSCPPPATCLPAWGLACGSTDDWQNDGIGSTDRMDLYSCADWYENGPEYTYTFSTPTLRRVTVTLSGMTDDLDLFVLDGGSESCNAENCIAHDYYLASFDALPGHTYYIVVDGYLWATSPYHIAVDCAPVYSVYLPLVSRR